MPYFDYDDFRCNECDNTSEMCRCGEGEDFGTITDQDGETIIDPSLL